MSSTARSSRLGARYPRELRANWYGVHSSRCLAPPRDKHVNREQAKKLRFMTHGLVPAVPKPVVLAPIESIRCGSASRTIPLAPAIRSRRRPRESPNHESRAPGQHGARRASAERSSGFGSIRVGQTTGFARMRAPQRQCRTTPFVRWLERVAPLLWRHLHHARWAGRTSASARKDSPGGASLQSLCRRSSHAPTKHSRGPSCPPLQPVWRTSRCARGPIAARSRPPVARRLPRARCPPHELAAHCGFLRIALWVVTEGVRAPCVQFRGMTTGPRDLIS